MSSSGGNSTSDWQPPSWTSSTSESSLFDNPADDGWGSEDTSTPPASYSGSAESSPPLTSTGVDPFAPTGGVQPSYGADYDAYSYTSDPAGYPGSPPGDGSGNCSSPPSTDPDDRERKPFFQINLGGSDSNRSSGSNSGPSGAIASGVISVVVAIFFGRISVFHMFVWFFILIGAIGTVRTLFSKRGNPKTNRICGGIGIALCIVAAIILLVEPHSGPGTLWLFRLWSSSH